MSSSQPVRGIVNGHWEPSPPRSPVTVVRTRVAKLLQKISHIVEPESATKPAEQQHEPMAAE